MLWIPSYDMDEEVQQAPDLGVYSVARSPLSIQSKNDVG